MQSILKHVERLLRNAIKVKLAVEVDPGVTRSSHIGDYSCPAAIKLFNQHKKTGSFGCASIKELAEKIISGVEPNSFIEKIEATPAKGMM